MIPFINLRHLETLKNLTLSVSGIKHMLPMDCRIISFSIIQKTKLAVSETTLKRLYGFAISHFNPSAFTLDALSIYCGYESWNAFSQAQPEQQENDTLLPFSRIGSGRHTRQGNESDSLDLDDPIIAGLLEIPVPTLILKTNAPEFTILTYNKAYADATHTQSRNIKGLTIWEAFDPQSAGGYGPTLLLESFHQAIYDQRVVQMEPLHYNIPSVVPNLTEISWWDIRIIPIVYKGVVKYLIINPNNITDKMLHQDAIEQALMKELTMAEDLAKSNVKLNLSNERLTESNGQLTEAKRQLEDLNNHLEERVFDRTRTLFESESKQRKLIDNAPVAIAILKGPEHIVETANQKIITYWGKSDHVINKPLAEALPELEGQPFIGILNEVRATGIPYVNPELCAYVNINGLLQPRYYDMIYQPVQHVEGITDTIFIVAVDITDHIIAKHKLEQSESILRLAVSAAGIGTWSVNPQNKLLKYNQMFAEIMGWDAEAPMKYEQALNQVTEEYRDLITEIIKNAIMDGHEYKATYAVRRFNDNKLIHISAAGKMTLDDSGENKVFCGVIWQMAEK